MSPRLTMRAKNLQTIKAARKFAQGIASQTDQSRAVCHAQITVFRAMADGFRAVAPIVAGDSWRGVSSQPPDVRGAARRAGERHRIHRLRERICRSVFARIKQYL